MLASSFSDEHSESYAWRPTHSFYDLLNLLLDESLNPFHDWIEHLKDFISVSISLPHSKKCAYVLSTFPTSDFL